MTAFYKYNLSFSDQVVAHFHEWMTGTGVLYLNEFVPQVATIFTTHATTIGRAISGNGLALYGKMEQYNGEAMARSFGMISRFSLEQKTAQNADAFTVVSNTTAREAEKLLKKAVDVVTPNGFSKSMILDEKDASEKREKARAKLFQVADALFNKKYPATHSSPSPAVATNFATKASTFSLKPSDNWPGNIPTRKSWLL